jgi:hypothetical protein
MSTPRYNYIVITFNIFVNLEPSTYSKTSSRKDKLKKPKETIMIPNLPYRKNSFRVISFPLPKATSLPGSAVARN